ncbi:hypothetical protein [Cellulomonas sp. ATA003]|uniref:hypothetical protein n=1 Tax=Cellulomonas sp. ATA003 TaxID=3073064 RepID=UPI002872C4DA|nr:hypothetical protein [Cellulomonas sp. ATA003]WNB84524.1 hypothetical protein REH70_11855 [Cellulomonas sp. ATA003]
MAAAVTSGSRAGAPAQPFDGWLDDALGALFVLADTGQPFGCDELHAAGIAEPSSTSHWGNVFRLAHEAGFIEPIGFRLSRRPPRRGGIQREWRGVESPPREAA